jgi:hypothetical protein
MVKMLLTCAIARGMCNVTSVALRIDVSGMWGRGNYFAVNASYSHGYSHSTGDKNVFFLASVLAGDVFTCPPDSNLTYLPVCNMKLTYFRMPPLQKRASKLGLAEERYDSVSGTTGGSVVYILYDNHKAYPKYLITYSMPK